MTMTMTCSTSDIAQDINTLASFLAHEQVRDLHAHPNIDVIVICASSVLHQAETLFSILQQKPAFSKTIVLVGGIGHSTKLIYNAVRQHARFAASADSIEGLPESRVLEKLLHIYCNVEAITSQGSKILIEDKSTNCGANATETKKVLEHAGITDPETIIIIQDPTMSLRTVASFTKAYEKSARPPKLLACPIFGPKVCAVGEEIQYDVAESALQGLWPLTRFYIPRLRDDAEGYGPRGKGFIAHVDVPEAVEDAYRRLRRELNVTR